ncbi:MAG: PilW family protein [Amphritea sp.]
MRRKESVSPVLQQQGFSLIELMIASVIGLLLLSAVLATFISSSRTYRLQESMSRVQESGRFVLEMMSVDIREAGLGLDNNQSAVRGYADALRARIDGKAKLLAEIDDIQGQVLYIPGYVVGKRSDGRDIVRGDITYFVAEEADGRLSLYKRATPKLNPDPDKPDSNPTPQPLIEGVEEVVFEYGEDTDNDSLVNSFETAADVEDWHRVVAVRLNVLVTGIDAGVVDQAQGTLSGPFNTVSTTDRRLYQVYKATIALRNRLP